LAQIGTANSSHWGELAVKQQPELPDFVRDLEIVQSLNRNLLGDQEFTEDPGALMDGATEISDDSV
jgi:hypothetical protein